MKLRPVLVNSEYQDPILLVPIPQKSENIMFDAGYCFRLKVRDIQKISRIFISHTHMDHFAGFDHILRLSLDLDKTIAVYGPEGIIGNVEGKLSGYTWNLAERVRLNFEVFEIKPETVLHKKFMGVKGYRNNEPPVEIEKDPDNIICRDKDFFVRYAFTRHLLPGLAFRMEGISSLNADTDAMKELGLQSGRWIGELKKEMAEGILDREKIINIDGIEYKAGKLADMIIRETGGTSVVYIVDSIFDKITAKSLTAMAKDADIMFCETAYLNPDKELARKNHHMTARQAATLAKMAQAKKLIPIHFSKRYDGEYRKLYEEAREVFDNVKKAEKYGE